MTDERSKVGRTLRLEPDLNDRLISLCAHLGVNPNSYLLNKVGEAILPLGTQTTRKSN